VGSGPVVTKESAAAKLTLSLRITGVRPDGYHEIASEMVTLDLVDTLEFEDGDALTVESPTPLSAGPDNLVNRALRAVDRTARVRLTKRIPSGAGLGGGSADAAAVLRWAGRREFDLAVELGADVPFCLDGGRALVTGIGETVVPLEFEPRSFVLLLLPFGIETVSVYRAWDRLHRCGELPTHRPHANDLEAPAIAVEPRLAHWRQLFAEVIGAQPRLAGSGSTWFVEGTAESLGLGERRSLVLGREQARLVEVCTTPLVAD
jgi:4-diphosphocytidyl-2-C-methyl-D-erythritol kinase